MVVFCSTGCGSTAVLKVSRAGKSNTCLSFYKEFLLLNFFLQRPKTDDALCKNCFFWAFETEVHHTITSTKMFQPGQLVAIGASGGKDSTVLAYVLKHLNEKYNYGLKLVLLSIDEGITGC
jgi:cytoplasmic tRNA 2-thiolation protein 1